MAGVRQHGESEEEVGVRGRRGCKLFEVPEGCWVALGVALFIEVRAAGTEQVGVCVLGKHSPLQPRAHSYSYS